MLTMTDRKGALEMEANCKTYVGNVSSTDEGRLLAINNRLASLLDELYATREKLTSEIDRVAGPVPQPCGTAEDQAIAPLGVVGRIEMLTANCFEVAQHLQSEVCRLDSL